MTVLFGVTLIALGAFAVVAHLRYWGRRRAVGERTSYITDQFMVLGVMFIVLGIGIALKG